MGHLTECVIVPAEARDVLSLKGALRKSDRMEVEACSGQNPSRALEQSWERSEMSWAGRAKHNGEWSTWGILGVARLSMCSSTGVPWMLGSDEMNRNLLRIGRSSKYYVDVMLQHYSQLENYIDARQTRSIKWLKWCGFRVEPAHPFGVKGLPFHRFWKERI
ncbi:MAG: hypothetical protein PHV34_17610 [Verrucomicrobiae bacterium]|nr:hypothetical protein [Verrucomicrobiae bacterium]